LNRDEVKARVEEVGIVPAVRVSSEHVARFAAEAVAAGGIPIVEIEMTVPGAISVIHYLVENIPDMLVGAGSVYDAETARRCIGAGACFLTTDGLDVSIIEFANKEQIAVWPAALTPTEVISAWKAGPDFVKILSLRAGRRRELHQDSQESVPAYSPDCRRRRKSADSPQVHPGRSQCARCRR
jgi:2-dehydro-3-deoxyphosphogluconate aldolase/(4S)-4-hydroxy-2-oxoglutarate aldolase